MRVYVEVKGAERFPLHTIRSKDELQRIFAFARIGSQAGGPRLVYRLTSKGKRLLIAKYVNGESKTTSIMRARRNPLWDMANKAAMGALRKLVDG
jgi:DNA-binding PadR family transcriptional regulator